MNANGINGGAPARARGGISPGRRRSPFLAAAAALLLTALLILPAALPAAAAQTGTAAQTGGPDAVSSAEVRTPDGPSAGAAEAGTDGNEEYRTSRIGRLLAALFFVLTGLMTAGVICALIVPAVKRRRAAGSADGRRSPKDPYRRFRIVWAVIYAVLAAATLIGMTVLNRVLTEYEAVQPRYEADRIFRLYFKDLDADVLWPFVEHEVGEFETDDTAKAYFASLLRGGGGPAEYHEVISDSAGVSKYAVSAGSYPLGYFTVVDDETRVSERYGLCYKKLQHISIRIAPLRGVTVFAPENAEVRINGRTVGEGYRAGDPVVLAETPYFPADDPSYRSMVNYGISGLYTAPLVEVISPFSVSYVLEYDEEAGAYVTKLGEPSGGAFAYSLLYDAESFTYSAEADYTRRLAEAYTLAGEAEERAQAERLYAAELAAAAGQIAAKEAAERERLAAEEAARIQAEIDFAVSEEIRAVYEARVETLCTEYTRFMYRKPSSSYRSACLKYIEKGSALYKYIQGYTNYSWFTPSKYTFSDFESSDYRWTDDTHTAFSCTVRLTVSMYGYSSKEEKNIDTSERFEARVTVSLATNRSGLLSESHPVE
jgi:hypothetical protein